MIQVQLLTHPETTAAINQGTQTTPKLSAVHGMLGLQSCKIATIYKITNASIQVSEESLAASQCVARSDPCGKLVGGHLKL